MTARRVLVVTLLAAAAPSGAEPRKLSRGVDLPEVPAAPPATSAAQKPRAAAKTVDLGSDRSAAKLPLPEPPRGGAAGFTFGDGRRGWVARIPENFELPTAAYGGGRVYVSGGFESRSMYALDAIDGHIAWAAQSLQDDGPTAPLYAIQEGKKQKDERLIFNTESCTLVVLDAASGKVVWAKHLGDPTLTRPSLEDGLVYASHPGGNGWKLGAYAIADGKEVWSADLDGEILGAPVVHEDAVYAVTFGGKLWAFDHRSGKKRWVADLDATSAPWGVGDELYLGRRTGKSEAQIVVSTKNGAVLRSQRTVNGDYLADVPRALTSKPIWAFEGSRPVVADGVRYEAMGGVIAASDPATGEARWIRRYAAGEHQRSVAAVAVAGPEVVVATRAGELYGLDVDTGYTVWAYATGKTITSQPIVARGWVYATSSDGAVIALEVGDSTLDGWPMWGGSPRREK